MLVTIENVTFPDNLADDGKGRDTIHLMSDTHVEQRTDVSRTRLFDLGRLEQELLRKRRAPLWRRGRP